MGVVWRARDEVLARDVAVKEVRAPAGLAAAELERMYRRLEREAWAAARISHRGVVTVYDVASDGGRPWIVMELVRGLSLADVLEAEGPMPPQRAAHLGDQVLAALRSAHDSGVLHRDVKPANVLIGNDGRVVLTDFGIASLEGSSAITMTGEVVGSPEFLAPERAAGRDPGPGADLWSLGVLLYTAVEGVSPFRRATPLDTLRAVVEAEPPAPRRAGALAPVLEGLLRKDPAERLPAAEAARMLRVVGAGGAVRDPGGPASDPAPAATAGGPGPDPRGGGPYGGHTPPSPTRPLPAPPTPTLPAPLPLAPRPAGAAGRSGAGPLLAAGIAVMLLAVAAVVWLLLRGGPGGGDPTGSGAPTGPATGTRTTGAASAPPAATASASVPAGEGQYLSVHVVAVRSAYRGSCPPPAGQAPAFTATVGVERLPVVLEYRWATRSGRTSGPGWQSVTYAADGPRSRELEHTELTHVPGAVFDDAVRLELRGPAELATEWVGTSMTCVEETPTGGASSPGTSPAPASPVPSTAESPGASPGESPAESPVAGGPDTGGADAGGADAGGAVTGGADQAALVKAGR
ncbi:serine/threonine-protein kinase [Streptomyces sp. NPDC047014]|uniref:serine/threonine-protein kinase n=1 Tax=Streptomyces sp. NPDC047014 TaxID=3155736 RepID=UPI00340AA674